MNYARNEGFDIYEAYEFTDDNPKTMRSGLVITRKPLPARAPLPTVIGAAQQESSGRGELLIGDENTLEIKFPAPIKELSFDHYLSVGVIASDLLNLEYLAPGTLKGFQLLGKDAAGEVIHVEQVPAKTKSPASLNVAFTSPCSLIVITTTTLGSVHIGAIHWNEA